MIFFTFYFCRAQPQLLSLKAELVLISINQAHPEKFSYQHFSMNNNQVSLHELEDNLILLVNGRRPQFWGKWKTTSIFVQMEEDLKFYSNLEDDLIFLTNLEDDINFNVNQCEGNFPGHV